MKAFTSYVVELRRLLAAVRVPGKPPQGTLAEVNAALDGGASRALRRLVDLETLRESGAFFTGSRLSRRAARLVAPTLDKHSVILDPSCGAGDLLLACADTLQPANSRPSQWAAQLRGRDLCSSFVQAAKLRLTLRLLTDDRASTRNQSPTFPELRVGCGMSDYGALSSATHVVLNPPFTLVQAPRDCTWAAGTVSAAALFLDRCLALASPDTQIVAILPDALRSGARYEAWRRAIEQRSFIDHVGLADRFDRHTDVNVFLLRLKVRSASRATASAGRAWNTPRKREGQTIRDAFDITVGAVVDYRDPHLGAWRPFIRARTLVPWTTLRRSTKHRRFDGALVRSPFVAVKRTSRPGDSYRAAASLVTIPLPVAVENHVIVLRPRDHSVATCRRLLALLKSDSTTDLLNRRIRCRHLTVGALADLPWTTT